MAEIMEPEEPLVAPSEVPEELKTIWEVWALLTREHVDRAGLDPKAVTEAAIRGMLLPLEDPQTAYVSAEYLTQSTQDLGGSFEGIGATVQMRLDGKLIIVAPIEGGPAEAAGLLSGDVILEVDGKDLEGLSLLEAVSQIRGRRGTTVVLLVLHLGEIEPAEISIVRDKIPLESVLVRSEPGDTIAHIRLTDFYGNTAEKLRSKINEAIASGAKALIIDVRDNPGGLLNAAIDVTSQFLEEGLVLYEEDGAGRRTNFRVREGGVATDIPMVVLANAGSASASEILAGAMQDHKRALVIGSTTFGKGTVNTFRRLGNGAGLYMSIARYYTPAGRSIEDVGVIPDIEVTSRDRQIAETDQLNKAIEILEAEIARLSRVPG
jgi:carboxyl-terminal processing protease